MLRTSGVWVCHMDTQEIGLEEMGLSKDTLGVLPTKEWQLLVSCARHPAVFVIQHLSGSLSLFLWRLSLPRRPSWLSW